MSVHDTMAPTTRTRENCGMVYREPAHCGRMFECVHGQYSEPWTFYGPLRITSLQLVITVRAV